MLAALEQLTDDGEVRLGRGEVDDQLDRRIGKDLVHRQRRDAVFGGGGVALCDVQIATTGQIDDEEHVFEIRQVNVADGAATDDGGAYLSQGDCLLCVAQSRTRSPGRSNWMPSNVYVSLGKEMGRVIIIGPCAVTMKLSSVLVPSTTGLKQ